MRPHVQHVNAGKHDGGEPFVVGVSELLTDFVQADPSHGVVEQHGRQKHTDSDLESASGRR